MRDFTVKKGVMGYVVNVGCQVAGFSNKEDLLKAITEYVNDLEATEKKQYNPTIHNTVPSQYGTLGSLPGTYVNSAGLRSVV